jgi:hypothetical protein
MPHFSCRAGVLGMNARLDTYVPSQGVLEISRLANTIFKDNNYAVV